MPTYRAPLLRVAFDENLWQESDVRRRDHRVRGRHRRVRNRLRGVHTVTMLPITPLKVLGFVLGIGLCVVTLLVTDQPALALLALLPGATLYAIALQREPLDPPHRKT